MAAGRAIAAQASRHCSPDLEHCFRIPNKSNTVDCHSSSRRLALTPVLLANGTSTTTPVRAHREYLLLGSSSSLREQHVVQLRRTCLDRSFWSISYHHDSSCLRRSLRRRINRHPKLLLWQRGKGSHEWINPCSVGWWQRSVWESGRERRRSCHTRRLSVWPATTTCRRRQPLWQCR